jgi:hypothetical protein
MKKRPSKIFTLKKIEGGSAYFSSGEDKAILPKNRLPAGAKVDNEYLLNISDPKLEKERNRQTSRDILNEIMRSK